MAPNTIVSPNKVKSSLTLSDRLKKVMAEDQLLAEEWPASTSSTTISTTNEANMESSPSNSWYEMDEEKVGSTAAAAPSNDSVDVGVGKSSYKLPIVFDIPIVAGDNINIIDKKKVTARKMPHKNATTKSNDRTKNGKIQKLPAKRNRKNIEKRSPNVGEKAINSGAIKKMKPQQQQTNNAKGIINRVVRAKKSETLSNKLFISNLHYKVTAEDMQELFAQIGRVTSKQIHYNQAGHSLGSAEVIFDRPSDATKAMRTYNGVRLDGRSMNIEIINSTPPPIVFTTVKNTVHQRLGGVKEKVQSSMNGGAANKEKKTKAAKKRNHKNGVNKRNNGKGRKTNGGKSGTNGQKKK